MSTLFDSEVPAATTAAGPPALRILGLDLSIGATGICLADGRTLTVKPKAKGDARLNEIRGHIGASITATGEPVELVVMEDVPSTMQGAAGKVIPMLHGTVRAMLLDIGLPYVVIAPATLKAYATGKGNADKTAMAMAAYKRAEIEFGDDNQCDAWWLRAAGLDWYGQPEFTLPQAQRERLTKAVWPAEVTR
ncbi:Holliday junction endonuclease [Streptomyces sp. NPDC057757]|uniref:Holliday junction endonuclease n=1 Tax=Streptomyces sp. NPDC057757 TaxID=3346241 RepID=UPI00369A59FC